MSVTTLKAPRISGRDRVIVLPNNKIALQSKGRRRHKTSAATRKKIAAGLRRFHLPLLTTVAVGIPLSSAVIEAGGMAKIFSQTGFFKFGRSILASYTGVFLEGPLGSVRATFVPNLALRGLLPLAAIIAIKRFGLFKGVNQKLARAKIPLRLS